MKIKLNLENKKYSDVLYKISDEVHLSNVSARLESFDVSKELSPNISIVNSEVEVQRVSDIYHKNEWWVKFLQSNKISGEIYLYVNNDDEIQENVRGLKFKSKAIISKQDQDIAAKVIRNNFNIIVLKEQKDGLLCFPTNVVVRLVNPRGDIHICGCSHIEIENSDVCNITSHTCPSFSISGTGIINIHSSISASIWGKEFMGKITCDHIRNTDIESLTTRTISGINYMNEVVPPGKYVFCTFINCVINEDSKLYNCCLTSCRVNEENLYDCEIT